MFLDQFPNYESRLIPSTKKDKNGSNLLDINWVLNKRDSESIQKTLKIMENHFKMNGKVNYL